MFYTSVFQRGNNIYVRGVDDNGHFKRKEEFKPTLWINKKTKNSTDTWKSLYGEPLYAVQPGSIKECRDYKESYRDVHGLDVYESPGNVYQYISEKYPDDINFDLSKVKVYTIDIETSADNGFPEPSIASERVLLITVKDSQKNSIVTWGLFPFKQSLPNVEYRHFDDEYFLLKDFIIWWGSNYPDVVTGWNSNFFDITYLYNRITKIIGEEFANKLSPWGFVDQKAVVIGGRSNLRTTIYGLATIDYLDLYKKFGTYSAKESYKLDHIAFEELGERKVKNPGDSFSDFWKNHWHTLVTYNVRDVELVDRLDAKMKLMDLALTMAYFAKVNFEDVFSPVKTWDVIIYNYLNDRKVVVPKRPKGGAAEFEGAYVKEPIVGKHNWCCSFDLNSLYPHLILQYNMSPETISDTKLNVSVDSLLKKDCDLSYAHEKNLAVAASGWCFKREERGILPIQMQRFYDLRIEYKNKMLQVKQHLEAITAEKARRGM